MKLVIFDCDGVLIDSEVISTGALADALASAGAPVGLDFVLAHFLGRGFSAVVDGMKRQFGFELDDDFEAEYGRRLLQAFEDRLEVMPGVLGVLDVLGVRSCVASSSSPARLMQSLKIVGLDTRFEGRIFPGTVVERGKPAPDLFLHVAERMAVDPPDCLVVEDSIPGLRAALAAGMTVWQFTGGSHIAAIGTRLPDDVRPHRRFDSFAHFFDPAPDLRRQRPNAIAE